MSEVTRHRPWGDSVPTEFVLASDYDQLKADSEVVVDLAESRLVENLRLKAENERLERKNANQGEFIKQYQDQISGGDLSLGMLILERDTLRTKLDEARELLDQTVTQVGRAITGELREQIDAWLERNKP